MISIIKFLCFSCRLDWMRLYRELFNLCRKIYLKVRWVFIACKPIQALAALPSFTWLTPSSPSAKKRHSVSADCVWWVRQIKWMNSSRWSLCARLENKRAQHFSSTSRLSIFSYPLHSVLSLLFNLGGPAFWAKRRETNLIKAQRLWFSGCKSQKSNIACLKGLKSEASNRQKNG